ncbi:MAG: hypothetical protein H6733_09920 [Alphaproteobacteria bacterium]|nr:hypothetical protein [Alphaproteobacteria bacterium]
MKASPTWARVLVASAVVAGLALRVAVVPPGFSPDEVGTVTPGGLWGVLTDPEIGTNPPLYRLLTTPWLPDRAAAWAGRGVSLIAGAAGIAAVARLAARAWGRAAVGVAAASAFAVFPLAVRMSGVFRVYALAALVIALHLDAVVRFADAAESPADRRRAGLVVACTACLLPWLHYTLVPLALGLGLAGGWVAPGLRGLWRWYVPSAVAALPLVPAVLFQQERRIEPQPVGDLFERIASLGMRCPDLVRRAFNHAFEDSGVVPPSARRLQALAVVAATTVAVLAWRRLPPGPRVLLVATASLLLGFAGIATQAAPRSDVTLFVAVPVFALLAGLPTLVRGTVVRGGAAVVLGVAVLAGLPESLRAELQLVARSGGQAWFVAWWADHPYDGPVAVTPRPAAGWLWFHATGQVPGRAPTGDVLCDAGQACFAADGRRWVGTDQVPDVGWLVDFHTVPLREAAARCVLAAHAPGVVVWTDCRPAQ